MQSELDQREDGVAIEIGGMPILLRSGDASFRQLLHSRYAGFVNAHATAQFEFDIELSDPTSEACADDDVQVKMRGGEWLLERGDFHARWNPEAGTGRISQSSNPYAIDSVLRIVHTLLLAKQGGFLLHAASAIKNGRSFLFSGVSGAGKTTISKLAPEDVNLLTDEISYVKRDGDEYIACGTPFFGELARTGENKSAAVSALYFLEKGPRNEISEIDSAEAVRRLLRNILFFAEDAEFVRLVFQSACAFVDHTPVRKLTFVPDQRVWDLIG